MTLFQRSRVVSRNGTGEVMPAMLARAPTGGKVAGAHFCGHCPVGGVDGVLIGDVDLMAEGRDVEFVADFRGDLGGLLAVEVQDHHSPALAGVAAGGGNADAAVRGCPGEDGGALDGGHDAP